jgi:uncharacterized lipoprotein YbaY
MVTVEGNIVVPASAGSFSGGTAHVLLEDVSYQDAKSTVVGRQVIPDVAHEAGAETRIPFKVGVEQIDARADYNVRVRIDVHGSRETQRGDYITTQSYPVITFDHPLRVEVHVQEVP